MGSDNSGVVRATKEQTDLAEKNRRREIRLAESQAALQEYNDRINQKRNKIKLEIDRYLQIDYSAGADTIHSLNQGILDVGLANQEHANNAVGLENKSLLDVLGELRNFSSSQSIDLNTGSINNDVAEIIGYKQEAIPTEINYYPISGRGKAPPK